MPIIFQEPCVQTLTGCDLCSPLKLSVWQGWSPICQFSSCVHNSVGSCVPLTSLSARTRLDESTPMRCASSPCLIEQLALDSLTCSARQGIRHSFRFISLPSPSRFSLSTVLGVDAILCHRKLYVLNADGPILYVSPVFHTTIGAYNLALVYSAHETCASLFSLCNQSWSPPLVQSRFLNTALQPTQQQQLARSSTKVLENASGTSRWLSGCSLLIDGNLSGTHQLLIATSSPSVLRPQVLVQTAAQRLSVLWSPAALSLKRQGAVAEQIPKKMVYVAVRLACPFVSCVAPRETARAPPKKIVRH